MIIFKNPLSSKNYIKLFLLGLLLFFTILMVKITLPYLAFDDHVAFLRIKRAARQIPLWKVAFYTHVFTSCFTLLAGYSQFSSSLLRHYPKWHRYMGRLYVLVILVFAAPSGLIMGFLANGGLTSRIAFVLLSILWFVFTWKAFQTARNKAWEEHAAFMFRSFALTLSALTLRAWKVALVYAFAPPPMDLYRLVAWLGWVPNLLLAEWLIRKGFHLKILSHSTLPKKKEKEIG